MQLSYSESVALELPRDRIAALTWKPLRFLILYRLLLAILLLALYFLLPDQQALGSHNGLLFTVTNLSYAATAVIFGFFVHLQRPRYEIQVLAQILVDVPAIGLLMHASGGVDSGLGILLAVAVAAGALLLPGKIGYFFAALASIALFGDLGYSAAIEARTVASALTQTGFLGATFFATAALAQVLAQRIRETEALAARRGVDLANLSKLNEYIIQHLQAGIVVVDEENRVRLMNDTAWQLLGMPAGPEGQTLQQVSPELASRLEQWQITGQSGGEIFRPADSQSELLPQFRPMGSLRGTGSLIFLEDTAALAQQAQEMKLAALGRLTAGIAHEIRNPLGAISHAGQLLAESPQLDKEDLRMTEIIREQSRRVNTIIEDVLHLSRRQPGQPRELHLQDWLQAFVQEFASSENVRVENIEMAIQPAQVVVRFDQGHLHQVLWNLCQNAIRYGSLDGVPSKVVLRGGAAESGGAYLDILDFGPGISAEVESQLFEPFFTTHTGGTGLGLYIARELCERNMARLDYHRVPAGGSCFRLSFAGHSVTT